MKPQGWRDWLEHGRQYEQVGIGKSGDSKLSPTIVYNLFSMSLESYCMAILDYHGTLADNHTFTDLMDALETVCDVDPKFKLRILTLEKSQQICAFDDFVIAQVDSIVNREFQDVVKIIGRMARLECSKVPAGL